MDISWLGAIKSAVRDAALDLAPIVGVIVFFQTAVLKRPVPHWRRILYGLGMVILGLALFLTGLEKSVFPIGAQMAEQLTDASFLERGNPPGTTPLADRPLPNAVDPARYAWVYLFAFTIGFAVTLAEPALIVFAQKARDVTTGAISPWGLRITVSLGVGLGVALGAYRIVTGTPLHYYVIDGYAALLILTALAPRQIIPLAYDAGGVTTSIFTVPLLVSLGLGLATHIPGRSPLLDGFGLIALASLFPVMTVLGYAMIAGFLAGQRKTTTQGGS